MAQDWRPYGGFPTCVNCTRSLTSEMCIRCSHCPANTCGPCLHIHRQTHDYPHGRFANQQLPPPHYQSYGHPPQQAPQYQHPPPGQHYPQYPPGQGQYCPPPPGYQHHPGQPFQQGQHFQPPPYGFPNGPGPGPGPSSYPTFQGAAVPRAGHRNWIDAVVDKGSALARKGTTRKMLERGTKLALLAGGLAVGADLAGLDAFSGDPLGGDYSFLGDYTDPSGAGSMSSWLDIGNQAATMSPFPDTYTTSSVPSFGGIGHHAALASPFP